MTFQKLRLVVALATVLSAGAAMAATSPNPTNEAPDSTTELIQPVDEILSMHKRGVEPAVIIAWLKTVPELPRLSAADLMQLQENAVSPDVMSALILRTMPENPRLNADDIIQLHEKGVPSDIISSFIHKGRRMVTQQAEQAAAATSGKTNKTYWLAMPRSSSVHIIPYRPYYYSPYYRYPHHYYAYPRYYGPSFRYGYGYGHGYCW